MHTMGWLRSVGSLKLNVTFSEYRLFIGLSCKRDLCFQGVYKPQKVIRTIYMESQQPCNALQHTLQHTLQHSATYTLYTWNPSKTAAVQQNQNVCVCVRSTVCVYMQSNVCVFMRSNLCVRMRSNVFVCKMYICVYLFIFK